MSKVLNVLQGPILGLIRQGPKGFITGLGNALTAFTGGPLAVAAAVGGALLSSSKAPPKIDNSQRLNASVDPRTPRKTAFGRTALATDVRDQEYTENQKYLHRWIVVASHKVAAIREIWFDDKLAWTAAGGPQGEFAQWLQVVPVLEGSASNVQNISPRMGSTRRYTGLAYVYFRFQILAQSKKLDSVFAQSVPTRITIRGDGEYVYDPRMDSTVAGGSGPCRANDQSTWVWTEAQGRNPALALLAYLLGWRINGKVAVGQGIAPARLDLASFAVAANICDETVTAYGVTEPRYRADGVYSEDDNPTAIVDNFKAAMNADLDDVGGQLRLTIFRNEMDAPLAAFTDADVLGDFTWRPAVSLDETFNIVRGTYPDPSNEALYQPNDYPQIEEPSPDGKERPLPLDFAFVQSPSQCQRLASLRLRRQQYAGVFQAEFQATAWKVQKNAVVTLSFRATGFVDKVFRVVDLTHREGGVVPMTLREENAALYDPIAAGAVNVAVPPTPYDPTLSPIADATNSTAQSALQQAIANSYPVGLSLVAADDGTITIGSHTRRYTDGYPDVSVNGDTIASGLTAGDFRAIGYDDEVRMGGDVDYLLFANDLDARVSATYPGRHYLGYVFIPTAGSPPSDGGGATPPGGNCVTTDTPIMLADRSTKAAGDIMVGEKLLTRHDVTLAWGLYPVEAIMIVDSDDVWTAHVGGRDLRATGDHLVYIGTWVKMRDLSGAAKIDGTHQVVKMTVAGAHTYVSNGILSHNIKQQAGSDA